MFYFFVWWNSSLDLNSFTLVYNTHMIHYMHNHKENLMTNRKRSWSLCTAARTVSSLHPSGCPLVHSVWWKDTQKVTEKKPLLSRQPLALGNWNDFAISVATLHFKQSSEIELPGWIKHGVFVIFPFHLCTVWFHQKWKLCKFSKILHLKYMGAKWKCRLPLLLCPKWIQSSGCSCPWLNKINIVLKWRKYFENEQTNQCFWLLIF